MYKKHIIGIDPGITGAICILEKDTGKIVELLDMPIMANGKGSSTVKNIINSKHLHTLLAPYASSSVSHLERVASRPGNGVASIFSLGDSFGCIRTVLSILEIPTVFITPQEWKKHYKIPAKADKDISRTLALQLFPGADINLKKHHNRAEAILIANFKES